MKLLPSLKLRKRYLVFEIISEEKFSVEEVKEQFDKDLLLFWGHLGLSRALPVLIKEKFNREKQRFIIKVNHKHVDELKSALSLSKSIKNKPVILKSIITSGTIKKASGYLN
ncbi:hypothetical protein COY27_02645 [Candidatus Woesearchaeota archaeon CG_4_10_14_0_2_um_filter_33_13]|nr:MAG: hypothetical protein COY27_02645 [Candidatus Woesearchaeota archaeon CG_4_10_14_0_2_um_filter_33_13]